MREIRFIKSPGFVYDLFFIFTLYFNKDYCITKSMNYSKSEKDADYYNSLLLDYDNIPNELFPIFWQREDGKLFLTSYYFDKYKEHFMKDYDYDFIRCEILNKTNFFNNIVDFYFPDIDESDKAECRNSLTYASNLVKNSEYNDSVKSGLYLFFINPDEIIDTLVAALDSSKVKLELKYEKGEKQIGKLQSSFNDEEIIMKMNTIIDEPLDFENIRCFYVSHCLLNKNVVWFGVLDEESVMIMLGTDYNEAMDYMIERRSVPELYIFGNAIAEKNRVEILNIMLEQGEVTVKEIEHRLGLTGTNAYYHLMLMLKANMLKTRVQGRVVYYSINNHYFKTVMNVLKIYE